MTEAEYFETGKASVKTLTVNGATWNDKRGKENWYDLKVFGIWGNKIGNVNEKVLK